MIEPRRDGRITWKFMQSTIHFRTTAHDFTCTMYWNKHRFLIFGLWLFPIYWIQNTNTSSVRYKLLFSLLSSFLKIPQISLDSMCHITLWSNHEDNNVWKTYSQNNFIKRSVSFPTMWNLKQNLYHCKMNYIKRNVSHLEIVTLIFENGEIAK